MRTLFAFFTIFATAFAVEPNWTTDYEKALKDAASQKKVILANFTGSDWCKWCKVLKKEVFDTKEFLKEANKKYIFLELDFPKETPQSEELKAQNKKLAIKFGIRGYPSIYIIDSKGQAIFKTGYQAGGPKAYLESLNKNMEVGLKRLALVEKARKTNDAKMFDEALGLSQSCGLSYDSSIIDELIKSDAKNETGLKQKWENNREFMKILTEASQRKIDPKACVERFTALIEKSESKQKKQFILYRSVEHIKSGIENFDKMIADVDIAIEGLNDEEKYEALRSLRVWVSRVFDYHARKKNKDEALKTSLEWAKRNPLDDYNLYNALSCLSLHGTKEDRATVELGVNKFSEAKKLPKTKIIYGEVAGGRYRLHISADASAKKQNKLVIWLHGKGGSGNTVVEPHAPHFLKENYALLVFDKDKYNSWGGKLLDLALKEIFAMDEIDSKKPILFGYSMGGLVSLKKWGNNDYDYGGIILNAIYAKNMKKAAKSKTKNTKVPFLIFMGGMNHDRGNPVNKVVAETKRWKDSLGMDAQTIIIPNKSHTYLIYEKEREIILKWLAKLEKDSSTDMP